MNDKYADIVVANAEAIARMAHKPQTRKQSGQPYIVHPERLVAKVKSLPGTTYIDVAAAWLHDVPEDVAEAWDADRDGFIEPNDEVADFFFGYSISIPRRRLSRAEFMKEWQDLIAWACGSEVLGVVNDLTYPTEGPEWKGRSRAEKNVIRYEHTAQMSDRAKRLKMVDRLDNCRDMTGGARGWIAKYIPESRKILEICRHVDEGLGKELEEVIDELERVNNQRG